MPSGSVTRQRRVTDFRKTLSKDLHFLYYFNLFERFKTNGSENHKSPQVAQKKRLLKFK